MDTLYVDEALLAIAKPAGITVIPARDEPPEASLQHRLEAQRKEKLWVVHRLDRDTSGVVLFARNAAAHRALSMAFESREVSKTYLAWTRGVPEPAEGVVDVALHAARKGRMRPAHPGEEGALASETAYRVVKRKACETGPIACVELQPRTGRQHQIRVHMRAKDAPLLVDPVYGRCDGIAAGALGTGSPAIGRLTLHARRIVFAHPATKQPLTIEAPLPEDLAALDAWLAT